jgi:hypothetical protein
MSFPKAKKAKLVVALNMIFNHVPFNWHLMPAQGYVVGILFVFRGFYIKVIGHTNRQLSMNFVVRNN